ncbi:MAG: hypothetical protein NVS1B11_18400 [Terriglobales bacterium]
MRVYVLDLPLQHGIAEEGSVVPLHESPYAPAFLQREAKIFDRDQLETMGSIFVDQLLEQGIQSLCSLPLETQKGALGTLNLGSRDPGAFSASDLSLLTQVAAQVATALDNARAYREIAVLTERLKKEKVYLQDEIHSERNLVEIIGESVELKKVLRQTKTVAPSDATVLVLRETGTGKELIARYTQAELAKRRRFHQIELCCNSYGLAGERAFRP